MTTYHSEVPSGPSGQCALNEQERSHLAASHSVPRYREMTADDIPSLFFVRTRTRENAYTLEQLDRLGINPVSVAEKLAGTFKGWLGVVDDRVVGFCMADSATGELWVLAVLPNHEGCGIGACLMSLTEQWLWQSRCSRAWLTTDVDPSRRAYGFYRHRGWTDWKIEDGQRWMELFPVVGETRP